MIYEQAFRDTYDRYYCQFGEPPKRMSATRGFIYKLAEEAFQLNGCYQITKGSLQDVGHLKAGEIEFAGVIISPLSFGGLIIVAQRPYAVT